MTPYWNLFFEQVIEELGSDVARGLSAAEASERLIRYGRNAFEKEHKTDRLKLAFNQLRSPLILILVFAAVVTIAIGHYGDALFIGIAIVINSLLGYWQENKAESALAELRTYLKLRARVVRDGKEHDIDAEEIVVGDILRLAQGDRVPADARAIYVNDVQIDESILTGESLPVGKRIEPVPSSALVADQSCMLFAGTLVTQGVCAAVVCRTGSATELGAIASLLRKTERESTPLQEAITRFSLRLSIVLFALTLVVFIIGLASGRPLVEMFLTAIAIAVSAIPEGLPISMTVILAIGVERMAKRKGVVRKLIAAEALGSATVVLTDKTGTLTMAEMSLSHVVPEAGDERAMIMHALKNASVVVENPEDAPDAWRMSGKIMERALVRAAAQRGVPYAEIADVSSVLQSVPFNAVRKFSISLVKEGDVHRVIVFGAPDILLARAALPAARHRELLAETDRMAHTGERLLGIATTVITPSRDFKLSDFDPQQLTFEGFFAFRDPVRPTAKGAIERVRRAGVRTVILTGDHIGTATAVAREVGIHVGAGAAIDAPELARLSDDALMVRLPHISVVARVTPSDKIRIVQLFQKAGEIVAMTGDGVNDAPSIKQANVGIAMGSGTEVSRSVADLVLLDDNFETIVAAIEEGRQILGNIRKVLVYLLSNVADELILIGGSILVGVPLPISALQILWVNFFSDSFPAVAFAFEKEDDALAIRPARGKLELFNPLTKVLILVIGVSTSALLFALYLLLLWLGHDPQIVQTFVFAAFGTYTLILSLSVRSLEKPLFSYPLFSNRYLTGGIVVGIALMAAAVYIPTLQKLFGTVALPPQWILAVALVGLLNIALIEIAKALMHPSVRPQ